MTSQPDTDTSTTSTADTDHAADPATAAEPSVGDTIIATVSALLRAVADRHQATLDPALLQEMAGTASAVMLLEMASHEARASARPLTGSDMQRMRRHIAATLLFQDTAAEVLASIRAQDTSPRAAGTTDVR